MSTETNNQMLANEIRRMAEVINNNITTSAKREILKYAQAVEDGDVKRLKA